MIVLIFYCRLLRWISMKRLRKSNNIKLAGRFKRDYTVIEMIFFFFFMLILLYCRAEIFVLHLAGRERTAGDLTTVI